MKIIKEGQIPGKTVHRATCNHCKTQVEFLREEGKVTYDQRDGDFISIACPLCGTLITSMLYHPVWRGPG